MHRIRIRYTKEGRVRFVSARDLSSVWERALRRADLPIAYSEGFHPHAKVSFPDALPVGVASTGEYAELTFAAPFDHHSGLARLSATLPGGMDILTYLDVPDGAPKLARMLRATLWELVWPDAEQPMAAARVTDLQRRSDRLLAADRAEVVRHRPDGDRTLDVRPALLALRATLLPDEGGAAPVLRAVLRNDGPTVRPTDLYQALNADPGTSGPPDDRDAPGLTEPRIYRRVAQGEAIHEGLREALGGEIVPLTPERLAGAA